MDGAGALMPSWLELWNEWEIQVVVVASFSLQVILFFFAGIRRYTVSSILKALLWLVYLLADVVATYALGHISSSLSKKSSVEHQLVAFWAPFLLLHLGGQDTITTYALEDNKLWLRHLLNMFVQVAGTGYVLYKYINAGGATLVPAAMLVLAAGVFKFGERIWALKRASKKGSKGPSRSFLQIICCICIDFHPEPEGRATESVLDWKYNAMDCFTKNKQFGIYTFIVMTAHALRHLLVKPLIIDRNEASIDRSDTTIALLNGRVQDYLLEDDEKEDASTEHKRHIGELYKTIEVELALMYDMLYTKAEVIHTRYGYCIRAISLVSCFSALVVFMKIKRDGYSTPNIVITFALLWGACALEIASVVKVIGSTWTYAILKGAWGWKWLANAILFARYHLVIVKDGRWSNSVGQFNFISFCVRSKSSDFMGSTADLFGLKNLWYKAQCTKHTKLSPSVKEFVWHLVRGEKSHMVKIEDVAIRSGYWARRFRGFHQSEQLDWSMSFEFLKSVLIWPIATSTFLNGPAIKSQLVGKDKDMAEAVNTLSDYMMYLLVKHPDILPIRAADYSLFEKACASFHPDECKSHQTILDYNKSICDRDIQILYGTGDLTQAGWDAHPGEAVLVKACTLAHTMLDMKLGLTHKMVIIGRVWTDMLCDTAINASGEFHARQLSNGGEFLTHILLLTEYSRAITKGSNLYREDLRAADESVDGSAGHVELNVDDGNGDEITEIR
ncbi:hypothetical protein CFC21_105685 [Triticum aestivum]|uniref:DUF4220 domain-containing protein n=3 Tax=Triticum TaxID=4564 RepID=A0A9R1ADV5_TRITD|nr:hypothetical protein CFC21_105685 [Triticum aestivum]VAI93509.1 unnamed protein product [Triticum turgidum subsp. durum]